MHCQTEGAASQGHSATWEEAITTRGWAQQCPRANYTAKVTAGMNEHDYLEVDAAVCSLSPAHDRPLLFSLVH